MSAVEQITLAHSELSVSRIGFGCDPMGLHQWGDTNERELTAAVRAAVERGINFFDTADTYGLGEAERILSRALGADRSKVVVASKFGVRRRDNQTFYDNSVSWFWEALEGTLRRLGTDYVDLYQVHYWDQSTPLGEVFTALEKARAQGKIRYYGVTNIDLTEHTVPAGDGLVSFSHEYSLANRRAEESILRLRSLTPLGFLAWGALGQGVLSGKYSAGTRFGDDDRRSRDVYRNFHGEKLEKNLRLVDEMRGLLPSYPGRSLTQLALRWLLDHLAFGVALVGIKRPAQLEENAGALGWALSPADQVRLDRLSRES